MKGAGEMPFGQKRAWTLVEFLIVVIIIGILASLALPNYKKMREGTYDKEVIAVLKLICAAEKLYRLEQGTYINATDVEEINGYLRLTIPTTSQANWLLKVVQADYTSFIAKALRRLASPEDRIWWVNESMDEPVQGGSW
jgi:prepilin-type N-terminal cleavage/methylation domain-containing protein